MTTLLSLLDAVMQGRIGPVQPGMALVELGALLGPPVGLSTYPTGEGWRWEYRGMTAVADAGTGMVDRLEIAAYELRSPPVMLLGNEARPDACLAMRCDLHAASRASAVLAALCARQPPPLLYFQPSWPEQGCFSLSIHCAAVEIMFTGNERDAGLGTVPASLGRRPELLAVTLDASLRLAGITWRRSPRIPATPPIPPADYLRGAGATPPEEPPAEPRSVWLAPLATVLAAGRLGPLGLPATRAAIGEALGLPRSFILGPAAETWCFGTLEMQFQPDGRLRWFGIADADSLRGDCAIFPTAAGALLLDLQGFDGGGTPGSMLRFAARHGLPASLSLQPSLVAEGFLMQVSMGQAALLFESRNGQHRQAPLFSTADIEARAVLCAIRWFDPACAAEEHAWLHGAPRLSAEAYLEG